ncbi:hypothetical protein H5410_036499 [Solanum commersonii]|uniref:Uncharacterized protein n=1 Tax=Solanum commersonii TaxID=4109 RepID=A0A9J5Y3P4_SOLCO|nr:hypothetical protein H5410_036499 [Solanum commersonii]
MDVVGVERVELAAYQFKGVSRIWYEQRKKTRGEGAPLLGWNVFENAFLEHFFRRELREAKGKVGMLIGDRSFGLALSSASALAPRNKNDHRNQNSQNFRAKDSESQDSVAQVFTRNPLSGKCGKIHLRECSVGTNGCYKC